MNAVLEKIRSLGIVPALVVEDEDQAECAAEALMEADLACAEITFRTPLALKAMERIHQKFPELLLGAGTVLTFDQAKAAADIGVQFLVSPGLNPMVVTWSLLHEICVIPGVATPTEVERAMELGLSVLKFFPAEAQGGNAYLKALSGPYPNVRFMPTGGISEANLSVYLSNPQVIACGGSWMVPPDAIRQKDSTRIKELTRRAVQRVRDIRAQG